MPKPDETTAERDVKRILIWGLASPGLVMIVLSAAGLPGGQSPAKTLPLLFLFSFPAAACFALFLMDRNILRLFSDVDDLQMRPTVRSLSARAQIEADELVSVGFDRSAAVVIVKGEEVVGGPLVILNHRSDPDQAAVGNRGPMFASGFENGHLLITTSISPISTSDIVVQRSDGLPAIEAAALHRGYRQILEEQWSASVSTSDADELQLEILRRDGETLKAMTRVARIRMIVRSQFR